MNTDVYKVARMLLASFIPKNYEKPTVWAGKNIIFSQDRDPIKGTINFDVSPFLIDPLNAWELEPGQGPKEVTVCAPQQMGKTLVSLVGLLWSMIFRAGLSLIYYTSIPKAEKVNEEKFEPLMKNIKFFRDLLALPGSRASDCFRLGGNLVYFYGTCARISSHTGRQCLCDEIDDWQEPKGENALNDARTRGRMFSESIIYKVCTPKGTDAQSRIWKEFKESSQGYWYLRCQGCGNLTMRSCDVHNLQWELDEKDRLKPETLRLICPKCGYRHVEAESVMMNRQGGYIHRFPELIKKRPGYQWGALASQQVSQNWEAIAKAQLKAGKTGRLDDQIFFDNSFRARPFKSRKIEETGRTALKRHGTPLPPPESIRFRFVSIDTQDDCFYWVVRGVDSQGNTYYLKSGKARDTAELAEVWDALYHGGKIVCGIIDEGGHQVDIVRDFALERPGLFTYKGNNRIAKNCMMSENVKDLILAKEQHYHDDLLHLIYNAQDKGRDYWYLPDELPDDYIVQMTSWKPNPAVTDGHKIENFVSDGYDHYFDCEKMMLVLLDHFKLKILPLWIAARNKRKFGKRP